MMVKITGKCKDTLTTEELRTFYDNAGWIPYTKDLDKLHRAIVQSLYVVTAWYHDELVGLLRVVGDGETIIYIQDILVLEKHRRHGIGTSMIEKVVKKYDGVRQKVLLTEEDEAVRGFFEEVGFMSCDQGNLVAFVRFD